MSVFLLKLLLPEMLELSEIFDTFNLLSLIGVRTVELIGTSFGMSLIYSNLDVDGSVTFDSMQLFDRRWLFLCP